MAALKAPPDAPPRPALRARRRRCDDVHVTAARAEASATEGYEALASGDWEAARSAFEAALGTGESADVLDGLGRALWWLRDPEGGVVHRERAYAAFRREGRLAEAARVALWLSREYAVVWRNDAASNGWLARAQRLLHDVAAGSERGWLALARSERARDSSESAALAEEALAVAVESRDPDLELRALAQLGISEISLGEVDRGLARIDEAMAAATAGDATTLETFADVGCTLVLACELAGDDERPRQWAGALEAFVREYDHVSLLAFCRSCCADVHVASGRIDAAEEELVAAVRELTEAGQRARCVQPAARLAELRVLQGRHDEAEQLLEGLEDAPGALEAGVALRLARGEAAAAGALLEARLAELGRSNLVAAPLLGRLVEAKLADGDVAAAAEAAAELEEIAATAGRERVAAQAALARGRVSAAAADAAAAAHLQEAVNGFAALRLRLDAARARLELARTLAADAPEAAVDLARRARNELQSLGADREADAAAAFMRSLGATAGGGARALGALSNRERDVLRLLGEGLTNREIAQRLFISPKTAEHHVGRIFRKLSVKTRAEAAAYAVRHLGSE
jgi:DNA-binding CsgD family transcriptional regulator